MEVAGGRDVSWLWLGVGVEGWTLDVAGGGGGPWMWLGVGMEGWSMDVAGVKDAWMRCESKASEIDTDDRTVEKKQTCMFPV